ncbi:ATP-binding protein [Zooshikella ganghwensis]|uniref:ATP-binding protein n=2 Tax=Zooshikella ganghwensis TaxID=202772 RepID=A0A4P9VQK2_9GAMM|nr:ATP-binding protein [Zooshikella ganghwensis]RDH44644.1 ATP-binding protein [Zooshikella ganghwensis]
MALSLANIGLTQALKAPRMVLYGSHGLGKTTFAASAPNPIFLFTEDGAGALQVNAFPLLTSFPDVISALQALYQEQHEFQTVVLDSLDHLEPLIWTYTAQQHGKSSIEDFGYGKGYGEALTYWRQCLAWLDALRNEKNMAIILIAHTQVKRFDSPETEPYDRYQIKLHDRASALIQESVDCVLFTNFKTVVKKTDVGFGNEVTRGITTGQRVLYTQETPAFLAKNRYGLPPEIPLQWDAFSQALPHHQSGV